MENLDVSTIQTIASHIVTAVVSILAVWGFFKKKKS